MSYNTVWTERVASRPAQIGLTNPTAKLELFGINTVVFDDDTDANLSLLAVLPLVYPGFLYAGLTFREYTCENQGAGLWYATATYSRQDPQFTFDTGGGSQKITQALAQRGVYGPSGGIVGKLAEVTSGSGNVFILGVDTTAGLTAGMGVTDSNGALPPGTVISSVTDSTHLALSNNATKTTGNPVVLACVTNAGNSALTVLPVKVSYVLSLTLGSTTATVEEPDDTTYIAPGDQVIAVAGAGIGVPVGTTVSTVTDAQDIVLSMPAAASGDVRMFVGNTGDATDLRSGVKVKGRGIPAGTTVLTTVGTTGVVLSNNATVTSNTDKGSVLTFSETELLFFRPVTNPPPDFKGAINVKDDSVEGVDVEIPAYHWEETYHVNPAIVTQDYRNAVGLMTGSVNSDFFRGLNPGECKFLGARGSQKGMEDFEITFRFAASPNLTNFQVGDIPVAQKLGWDYLWISYDKKVDSGSHRLVQVPAWAVIDQVFPMVPFSTLGI